MVNKPWRKYALGEVLERIIGGGTPSRSVSEYYTGTIPWATVKDITSTRLFDTLEHITEEAVLNSSTNIVPKGTVVLATRMAVGKCFITMTEMAINQDLKALIPNTDYIYSEFLLMWLQSIQKKLEAMATGTTVKGIRLEQIKSLLISVPPLPEQRKIASILTTVDEAIEKTKAIIQQTEKVKKGLMQQLLTKGIGHTKFKKTEIGEIPETWDVRKLEDLCIRIFVGIATSTTDSYTDDGIPIIRNQNIKEDYLDTSDLLMITEEFSERNKNKKLKSGDVLTVRTGYPGISCVVPDNLEGSHTFTTLVSRPKKDVLDSYFLSRYINSDLGKKFVRGGQAGGAQQNLNVSVLKKLLVPLPSLDEQREIVAVLESVDMKIRNETSYKEQLVQLKSALMNVLLTGKVRVKVDEDAEVVV